MVFLTIICGECCYEICCIPKLILGKEQRCKYRIDMSISQKKKIVRQ